MLQRKFCFILLRQAIPQQQRLLWKCVHLDKYQENFEIVPLNKDVSLKIIICREIFLQFKSCKTRRETMKAALIVFGPGRASCNAAYHIHIHTSVSVLILSQQSFSHSKMGATSWCRRTRFASILHKKVWIRQKRWLTDGRAIFYSKRIH